MNILSDKLIEELIQKRVQEAEDKLVKSFDQKVKEFELTIADKQKEVDSLLKEAVRLRTMLKNTAEDGADYILQHEFHRGIDIYTSSETLILHTKDSKIKKIKELHESLKEFKNSLLQKEIDLDKKSQSLIRDRSIIHSDSHHLFSHIKDLKKALDEDNIFSLRKTCLPSANYIFNYFNKSK